MMWFAVLTTAVAAFGLRISMLFLTTGRRLPSSAERALDAAAPAVIAAMLLSELLGGSYRTPVDVPQAVAAAAAFVVVATTRHLVLGLVVGLAVLGMAVAIGTL